MSLEARDPERRYVIAAADSALAALNLFFEHEELSTAEIGKRLGVSRSTAFRLMVTLERRGFVTRTASGKYRLGLNLFSLGMLAYNRMELVNIAHPVLQEVAAAAGETCHIATLDGGVRVIFLDRALGSSWLKMDTALGYSQVAHCTATGKAMLAHQPEAVLQQYVRSTTFVRSTSRSIRDARELLRTLEQVRRDGYACDNEESELGLTCYAVPLLDQAGRPYAAISLSGPTTRMEQNKAAHLQRLQAAAARIAGTI